MPLSNAERQKAYRERNASSVTSSRNVTVEQNVTLAIARHFKEVFADKSLWEWDEHHIYQKCPHGRRYCKACGTTVPPFTATPEQWTEAHRRILADIARQKENGRAAN